MKKFIKFVLPIFLFFSLLTPVWAQEESTISGNVQEQEKVTVYFFWSQGCPHCGKEKEFLKKLQQKYPQVEIKDFEISTSQDNLKLLEQTANTLNVKLSYVPFTVVGEHYFSGYNSDETTGTQIEAAVECALETGCKDIVAGLITPVSSGTSQGQDIPETLNIPFFGQIRTREVSLPILTIILGLLDGFNPCAMWTLLFLISLLLGMEDKKRRWILGVAFIGTSAFVYFLFMAAWLNLFRFLGFVIWARLIVGLVAFGMGVYSINKFMSNKKGGCEVAKDEKRQKVFAQLKEITQNRNFILALIGIILLAMTVNIVELICSAGLPAVYTQVLAINNLPNWLYYLYLIGYIFFFMLDDLFVFLVAMITLKAIGIESKYARVSQFVGGLIMILIGILMLFKPEWLMFG